MAGMHTFNIGYHVFLIHFLILAMAILVDLIFGEPPDPAHPTVWMGRLIALLKPKVRGGGRRAERIKGILLCLSVSASFVIPSFIILYLTRLLLGLWAYIVLAAVVLKTTFSIKGMSYYTLPIARAIEAGNVDEAKRWLPFIVRRDPKGLSQSQVISAAVESIGESTVDGLNSPIFYFALFGVPGAVLFRVISTLDSMVGYKDPEHINVGWFSAKLDTIANYIPARLTALLMVLAAAILRMDWKSSLEVLKRDRNRTESVNAGWPMSALAGALNVQLEKPGSYRLGDGRIELSPKHIPQALRVMRVTMLLFAAFVSLPMILLRSYLGFIPP